MALMLSKDGYMLYLRQAFRADIFWSIVATSSEYFNALNIAT